jgi:uncharacterized oligopeptide transporter (OPT) family protein
VSADLTCDFRIGFLLRTSPRLQWFAQSIGALAAVFIAPAIFLLFATAYPCILAAEPTATCAFEVPSAASWRAVAVAATDPAVAIPASSRTFAIVMAVVGAAMVAVRNFLWTGSWAWMRRYHPNMMTVALAFLVPSTVYGTAFLIGAVVADAWARLSPRRFEAYGFAVAAGLLAGEGVGGVANAVLAIIGIEGRVLGLSWGCPAGQC